MLELPQQSAPYFNFPHLALRYTLSPVFFFIHYKQNHICLHFARLFAYSSLFFIDYVYFLDSNFFASFHVGNSFLLLGQ